MRSGRSPDFGAYAVLFASIYLSGPYLCYQNFPLAHPQPALEYTVSGPMSANGRRPVAVARSLEPSIYGQEGWATGTFGQWCVIFRRLEWRADGINSSWETVRNASTFSLLQDRKARPILLEVTVQTPEQWLLESITRLPSLNLLASMLSSCDRISQGVAELYLDTGPERSLNC